MAIVYTDQTDDFEIEPILLNGREGAVEVTFPDSGDVDEITFDTLETAIEWADNLAHDLRAWKKENP